jgi:transcriptional regulator with XRE-family HTH domain
MQRRPKDWLLRINIGARICAERKAKNFSQADLERRCGLARCRISWLEHGRAVPTLETVERIADALEIPVHRLLLEDQAGTAGLRPMAEGQKSRKKGARVFGKLRKYLCRMRDEDRVLLVFIAEKMAGRNSGGRWARDGFGQPKRRISPVWAMSLANARDEYGRGHATIFASMLFPAEASSHFSYRAGISDEFGVTGPLADVRTSRNRA